MTGRVPGRLSLVSAPSVEPVTLAEAKAHLRVESAFTADDSPIALLLQAARELCESHVDRSFVHTTWDYILDSFPGVDHGRYRSFLPIPKADLASVASVTYVDTNGDTQELTQGTAYAVVTGVGGGIHPASGATWPTVEPSTVGGVSVRFVAGYGSAASSVPATVKAAVLLTLTHLYEHRGDGAQELPPAAQALLGAARWGVL